MLVAAVGVVYGDIGTSPLYTLKEVFSGHYGVQVNHDGVLVVLLVIGFESSSALAAAYGVAVTGTMLITTILSLAVVLLLWKTPRWLAIPLLLGFLLVDGLYFAANAPKIFQGGAFPVIAGIGLFILMTTWKRGRKIIVERLDETALPLPLFISSIRSQPPHRVQGMAVFLTAKADAIPHALLHNLLHN